MPLNNSYIWYATPSKGYQDDLNKVISTPIFTNIPNFSRLLNNPMHLTLGLAAANPDGQSHDSEVVAKHSQLDIIYGEPFSKSIILLPTDVFVSEQGFICVDYGLNPLENQGDIVEMHRAVMRIVEKCRLVPNHYYSEGRYRPHLTIGKLPYHMQESVDYINKNKDLILDKLSNIRLLNIYNIKVDHYTDSKGSVTIFERTFKRRDYGVIKTIPHIQDPMNKSYVMFHSEENAKKCIHFLYQLGSVPVAGSDCESVNNSVLYDGSKVSYFEMENEQIKLMRGIVNNI